MLLVDDEDMCRITARFIAKDGYRVLTAADGAEALQLARHCREPIACLVTDVVMAGMDGRQLAHRLLALRPEVSVVFISGYSEGLIDDDGRSLEPGRTIVGKPFSGAQLREAIHTALSAGAVPAH